MKVYHAGDDKAEKLLARIETRRQRLLSDQVMARVRSVVTAIRKHGDRALMKHIRESELSTLAAREIQLKGAVDAQPGDLPDHEMRALDAAWEAAQRFHRAQVPEGYTQTNDGTMTGWRIRPVPSVGVVVPGGDRPQLSTLILTVVPARLAGVRRIAVAVSPRAYLGSPALRYLLRRLELEDVFLMSGVHAVAALAYGTESVSRVSMIVAPGGAEIQAAKLLVARDTAVDLRGGPPEVAILADTSANAEVVASDLLCQLEHDPDALGVVLTTSERVARRVDAKVKTRLRPLPKDHPVREALKRWGVILVCRSLEQACEVTNRIAPSRVQLLVDEPLRAADRLETAAMVLMGPWTPPALADVAAGVSHVVPTMGGSAVRGPLGVVDFVRTTALVRVAAHHYPKLAATARTLAELEDLPLHEDSLTAGERGER